MIELAVRHRDALRDAWQRSVLDPELRWYHGIGRYCVLEPNLKDTTWEKLEMVSVSGAGKIIGYLAANFDQSTSSVDELAMLRFPAADRMLFGRDAHSFLQLLFDQFNIRHITWSAAVENPAHDLYERLVAAHGAREVGIVKDAIALTSGETSDKVIYQLTRSDYHANGGTRRALVAER